jgi:hypothetical protein
MKELKRESPEGMNGSLEREVLIMIKKENKSHFSRTWCLEPFKTNNIFSGRAHIP